MELCPCGSGKDYTKCCEPFIRGALPAPTAEALMRSRYTAYVKQAIDYIESTHSLEKRDEVSIEETRKWASESKWLSLQILGKKKGLEEDQEGEVEFIASYEQAGLLERHHEVGTFKKTGDRWFYEAGKFIPTQVVRTSEKIGRNDPCACGSGKKFKKCCGAL